MDHASITQADRIIGKFGGLAPMARTLTEFLASERAQELGFSSRAVGATTVQKWRLGGFVPAWWMDKVLAAAEWASVPVTKDDFFRQEAA